MSLRALLLAAALLCCGEAAIAESASSRFCDRAAPMTALQQDRLLRLAAVIRHELEGSGATVALIARSGLDLSRFGVRYSHSGVSLKASDNSPWSVRQLYYACDERRPRLYDQGLAGFVFGTDDANVGYVSIVLPGGPDAVAIERAARDTPLVLHLLGGTYSANAYPFSVRYENCNQWVAELLATAWGALGGTQDLRGQAQHWLGQHGYEPSRIDVGSHWLMAIAPFIPLIHLDDHPQDDLYALRMSTSLPAGIESFAHERAPAATRIEICHDGGRAVIRHGWSPVADGCRPQAGDRVLDLDADAG